VEQDLIIVKITQTEHLGVKEAASGDWTVASAKARHFTRLVAVGQRNIELGVFEIVGHTDIPVPAGASNRVRFELVPCAETLTQPLDDLFIVSSVRKYAYDFLSGDHPEPTARPAARERTTTPRRTPAPEPFELVRSVNTCPVCLLDIEDCLGH
jgi:hypothetical protein